MMAHNLYITHLARKDRFIVGDYRTCYDPLWVRVHDVRVRVHDVVPDPLSPLLEDLLSVQD